MKVLVSFLMLFCMIPCSYPRGGPNDEHEQRRENMEALKAKENASNSTDVNTNIITICGVVKKVSTSTDKGGSAVFVDGKIVTIEKSREGMYMAIASINNGLKFCCNANNLVCKSDFSVSK